MDKHDYLVNQLTTLIKRFGDDSTHHKRMYRAFRYTILSLTAVSTVLAGYAAVHPNHPSYQIAIMAITAFVTLISSFEILRKPGELWIHERVTYYALQDLLRRLEFESSHQNCSPDFDDIFKQLQSILRAAGDIWSHNIVELKGKNHNSV